jgi:hypothetical protein
MKSGDILLTRTALGSFEPVSNPVPFLSEGTGLPAMSHFGHGKVPDTFFAERYRVPF